MNFVGSGLRLRAGDLAEASGLLKVDVGTLRAVLQVETSGSGFDGANRPKILFEPHILYRELGRGPKRDKAVAAGLAYARQGAKPYPAASNSRYGQLAHALAIDPVAALHAASWGLPQIMGFNFGKAGYPDALAMVRDMMTGERAQLFAMVRFIAARKLADALRRQNWTAFALGYNGPRAVALGYPAKLARAYAGFSATAAAALVLKTPAARDGEAIFRLASANLALGQGAALNG